MEKKLTALLHPNLSAMTPKEKRMKVRIIKRTYPDEGIRYIIQTKFLWWWRDGKGDTLRCDTKYCHKTIEEAKANLWRYDDTKIKEELIINL